MSAPSLEAIWRTIEARRRSDFLVQPDARYRFADLARALGQWRAAFDAHGLKEGDRIVVRTADEQAALGARPQDMVPFESYAETARRLTRPSSLARALASGATAVERIDRLVAALLEAHGMSTARLAAISARIDSRLDQNRKAAGQS
ncbi:MAG: hypothetical protein ACMVO5_07845 [Polymorphobacter sp.]|uniref:hypothetical protein n=1 Tax=Polymorphobacter sp. TaxID=1909290 RepID=UPI003A8A50A8